MIAGRWYRHSTRMLLRLVSVGEEPRTVKIQYRGGHVRTVTESAWAGFAHRAEPMPEGWEPPKCEVTALLEQLRSGGGDE